MAYALVKAGTAATNPSFGQATAAGNLLIAWINCTHIGGTIATTEPGWAQAVADDPTNPVVAIWYKPNSSAGETAPVFTVGSGSPFECCLAEFSGGATSSPVDQTTFTGSGTATSPLVLTMPSADAAAGQLVIALHYSELSKSATTTTADTYNNGATANTVVNEDATSTNIHDRFSWGITTGKTNPDQVSMADTSMNISSIFGCIASFKLAGAASTKAPVWNGRRRNFATHIVRAQAYKPRWIQRPSGILTPAYV